MKTGNSLYQRNVVSNRPNDHHKKWMRRRTQRMQKDQKMMNRLTVETALHPQSWTPGSVDLHRKAEQLRPSEDMFKRKPRQGNYTSSRGQRKHYLPNPIGFWNHDDAKMHHECGLVYWWKKQISVPIEDMTEEDIIENDKFDAKQRGVEYVPRQIPIDPPPREEAGVNLPKKGKGKGKGKAKEGKEGQKSSREQAHASGSGSSKGQSSRDTSNGAGDEERAIDELFSEEEPETAHSTRVKASNAKANAKKSRITKGKGKLETERDPAVLAPPFSSKSPPVRTTCIHWCPLSLTNGTPVSTSKHLPHGSEYVRSCQMDTRRGLLSP
jgi:hypothetical protein